MSFENKLKPMIVKLIDEEEYMFKETLTDDTIMYFSTKPKDWYKSYIREYLKKRYQTLSLYCRSHCQQEELNEDKKFDTIEEYIEFYKPLNDGAEHICEQHEQREAIDEGTNTTEHICEQREQRESTVDNTDSNTKDNN